MFIFKLLQIGYFLEFFLLQVFTVEEMMPHVGHLPGLHTKNLFLRDKKKKGLWLLSVRHDKDVNLNDLAKKISISGGLRLADEAILLEKLGVRQGCVTAFALINDVKNEVKFLVDSQLLNGNQERIYLHPLENSATTGISPSDFKKFLKAVGHDPTLVDFD